MEICTDKNVIARILTHPSVFHSAADDGSNIDAIPDIVDKLVSGGAIFLLPSQDTLFFFKPVNHVTYEIHIAVILSPDRGKAHDNAIKSVRWIFDNTPCVKIISYIPEFHKPSILFASMAGLKEEGRLEKSFLSNGVLHDTLVMGGTKRYLLELYGG